MSVEVAAPSALATSARFASFSYPTAIASIVDRASASRIFSARLLASVARAIHSGGVLGSAMIWLVAELYAAAQSHLSDHPVHPDHHLVRLVSPDRLVTPRCI